MHYYRHGHEWTHRRLAP
nr:hypothetical protein [Legionella pneumophila]